MKSIYNQLATIAATFVIATGAISCAHAAPAGAYGATSAFIVFAPAVPAGNSRGAQFPAQTPGEVTGNLRALDAARVKPGAPDRLGPGDLKLSSRTDNTAPVSDADTKHDAGEPAENAAPHSRQGVSKTKHIPPPPPCR